MCFKQYFQICLLLLVPLSHGQSPTPSIDILNEENQRWTPSIEHIKKLAFCVWCSKCLGWLQYFIDENPGRDEDKTFLIGKLRDERCVEFFSYPDQIHMESREFCISTATRLINERLEDVLNYTNTDSEETRCNDWFPDQECLKPPTTTPMPTIDPLWTPSIEAIKHLAFCVWCPKCLGWLQYFVDEFSERREDKAFMIEKLKDEGCVNFISYPDQIHMESREFCISTSTRLINERLADVLNDTIMGSEETRCNDWFPDQECLKPLTTQIITTQVTTTRRPRRTVSPEELTRIAFCTWCPSCVEWLRYMLYNNPEKRDDKEFMIERLTEERCMDYKSYPNRLYIRSREFCISTSIRVVNERLKDVLNHTLLGWEHMWCDAWFPDQECERKRATPTTTQFPLLE